MMYDPGIIVDGKDGVYEPAEDSFLMLESVEVMAGQNVLEIGTGSGFIALHCARAGARVTATDVDANAIMLASQNALANSLDVEFIRTDLFHGIEKEFDVIIFNPPYLMEKNTGSLNPQERLQVAGGRSGAETSLRFLEGVKRIMKDNANVFLLVSSESEEKILAYLKEHFEFTKAGEKKLFFEMLSVYQIRCFK